MSITLDGSGLTIETVVRIARNNEKVELCPNALKRMEKCRAMVEKKIDAKEIYAAKDLRVGLFESTEGF